MKKLLAIVLMLMMAFTLLSGALAESLDGEPMHVKVGVTTRLSGHFFTDKWGANSADIDIRELIHGHNTVAWEQNGNYALNATVIKEVSAQQNQSTGDKIYTIAFNEGLVYNDGTPINAYDYAFSVLLLSSPQFNALGGTPTGMSYFTGYEAYQNGQPFSGVRVIDELTLQLTLDGRFLPYFYEITLLNIIPYPIDIIAPGCQVKDDGNGAYIDGPFTTELMELTVLNEETGYLYKPYVSAGPYAFVSFDPETHTAEFVKNELYAGNFERVQPTIDGITVVFTNTDTAVQDIQNGTVDIVNKISDSKVIAEGMSLMGTEELALQTYLRTGLSFISFACEIGPTQSANVRKALAYCVDVNAVKVEYTQEFGATVYGYYGMGQWMAVENQDALAEYEKILDPNEAIYLLQDDGWILNENGEPYDESAGGVRYRMNESGEMEKLSLKWAQPEETAMSDLLTEKISMYAEAAGIELVITKIPFDQLLMHYYRQTDREYHMFSLATNFNLAFDPYYTYHTGDEYQGEANKTGLRDEELMNLALEMRQTEVGDNEAYTQKWLDFQARWNELQPMIPLYSNVYFDFYRTDLQKYNANAYVSWATAIVYSYIGEPEEGDTGDIGEEIAVDGGEESNLDNLEDMDTAEQPDDVDGSDQVNQEDDESDLLIID